MKEAVVRFQNNFLLTMTDAPPVPPLRSVASYGGTYMVKSIPLSQGYEAIVDDDWYEMLSNVKWHCQKRGRRVYAATNYRMNGKGFICKMHRTIMDAPPDKYVDHINGNGLDNRRCNLRLADHSQNCVNKGSLVNNNRLSVYYGILFVKNRGKWIGCVQFHKKKFWTGYFLTEKEAALARDNLALKIQGQYASLNFPLDSAAYQEVKGGV